MNAFKQKFFVISILLTTHNTILQRKNKFVELKYQNTLNLCDPANMQVWTCFTYYPLAKRIVFSTETHPTVRSKDQVSFTSSRSAVEVPWRSSCSLSTGSSGLQDYMSFLPPSSNHKRPFDDTAAVSSCNISPVRQIKEVRDDIMMGDTVSQNWLLFERKYSWRTAGDGKIAFMTPYSYTSSVSLYARQQAPAGYSCILHPNVSQYNCYHSWDTKVA